MSLPNDEDHRPATYHARLSAHLQSLLSTHLGKLADPDAPPPSMRTDMHALRERDREHSKAWMVEGYRRYVGGAGDFELRASPEEVLGRKRRRCTDEPGLLVRRGARLRLVEGSAVAESSDEEGGEGKRRRIDGSTRRTLSAGPATPPSTVIGHGASKDPSTRQRDVTPDLAFLPSSVPSVQPTGIERTSAVREGFTLQQPPRRPFRRPLQPTRSGEEQAHTSQGSVLAASQAVLLPRAMFADVQGGSGSAGIQSTAAAAAAAIGTSLSASSALAHTITITGTNAQTEIGLPVGVSPSIGSLTSASLGCARAAMLTPLMGDGAGETASPLRAIQPDQRPPSEPDAPRPKFVEKQSDARSKADEEMWACFMDLGEMGTPVGEGAGM